MRRSARQLEEELARLERELEAASDLERATERRHEDENTPETEVVLEARKTAAKSLRKRRVRLLGDLNQRAVEEQGWAPDDATGEGEATPGCGKAGTLRIGPHPLLPERGFVIHDRKRATVAWVRGVPSPALAAEILAEHGVKWEEELLSHSLSPVPEEAEEQR
jgi:hypothetical protein